MDKKFGAFSSSTDPQRLGETVTGLVITLSAIVIFVFAQFGVTLFPADVEVLAMNVGNLVTVGAIAYGSIRTLYGAFRKFVVHISQFTK